MDESTTAELDEQDERNEQVRSRPRVICHMLASIDGRIVVDDWPLADEERGQYEAVHASYAADGWLCGRLTMERHFAAGRRDDRAVLEEYDGPSRDDYRAPGAYATFAFAFDPWGRLVWESGDVGGDHLVAVLTHRVSDEYLAALRARGVSYLLAGERAGEIDATLALEKIGARFGVRTLMLEGGGGINGNLLRAGLVDEISLLVVPVADGRVGSATLFDIAEGDVSPHRLMLEAVERRGEHVVWLRYRVQRS